MCIISWPPKLNNEQFYEQKLNAGVSTHKLNAGVSTHKHDCKSISLRASHQQRNPQLLNIVASNNTICSTSSDDATSSEK